MRMFSLPLRSGFVALLMGIALGTPAVRAQQGLPSDPLRDQTFFQGSIYGGTESELSAAQAIAEIERRRIREQTAFSRTVIQNINSYVYDLVGDDETEMLFDANVRALKSSASRLYFGDYILVGRRLLEPYLRIYSDRFVASREILEREVRPDGQLHLRVRIIVDLDSFYNDLSAKRFLSEPQIRPVVAVVMAETVDGVATAEPKARERFQESLRRVEVRAESEFMGPFSLDVDASSDPELAMQAVDEAERGGVDVLITGSIDTRPKSDEIILFDQLYFTEGTMTAELIRVDTGEVMRRTSHSNAASGATAQAAYDSLIEALAEMCTKDLTDGFFKEWSNILLDRGDYRFMVNGASPETLTMITNMMKTLSPEIELYVKASYGDVYVLNVFFPNSRPAQMEQFLRRSRLPQFRVHSVEERKFELDVL